jgi:hypothetical protein
MTVRLAVLERQAFVDRHFDNEAHRRLCIEWYEFTAAKYTTRGKVKWLLELLFRGKEVQLDHDPALVLRRISKRTGRYIPAANNPDYLVYRLKSDHLHKSTGRRPGAERTVTAKGSDAWLAKKFRKLEKPKGSKSKIPSRPFPRSKRPFRKRPSSSATRAGKDF